MLRRLLIAMVLATSTVLGSTSVSTAGDDGAYRDLAVGTDYRLRVAAALAIGKSRSPGARPALEGALTDAHPAVRAAAAAALGALGDATSVPALRAALDRESTATVRSQLESTLKRLSKPAAKARFLVSLGKFENRSGVRDAKLDAVLRDRTRAQVAQVPGVEVLAEGADIGAAGKSRKLPAFKLDGTVLHLSKRQGNDGISFSAKVEYMISEMPGQTLKGSMSGSARALAEAGKIRGQSELSQLQMDAVAGAVESALRGATPALEAASGSATTARR
jgi:HEAT repeats